LRAESTGYLAPSMNTQPGRPVHAIVPLSVLEAMQHLDSPPPDESEEFRREVATKRLGTSRTVAMQIDRFRRMARRNLPVDRAEATALLRLAGRRTDAGMVFADAGRRAARHGVARVSPLSRGLRRILPGFARRRLGMRLVRRVVREVLDVDLQRSEGQLVAVAGDAPSADATTDGSACGLYGSAMAAILRTFTDFDGAVLHDTCRAKSASSCRWHAASAR
jgi:hypothetical protein